jgi:hypothetical protein
MGKAGPLADQVAAPTVGNNLFLCFHGVLLFFVDLRA